MHESRVAEKRDRQFPIVPSINSTSEDLVDQVVYGAMQEVVPWELEEKILYEASSAPSY